MSEWIIVAIVAVVLLFSAKKLPDMARGLGQSMRIFKAETRGMQDDQKAAAKPTSPDEPTPQDAIESPAPSAPGRASTESAESTAGSADPATRPGSTST